MAGDEAAESPAALRRRLRRRARRRRRRRDDAERRLRLQALMRERHDLPPRHRGQDAARQVLHRSVVVVAEPDAADEVAGEGVEPGVGRVVGGAGLSGYDETGNLGRAACPLGHDMGHDLVHLRDLVRRQDADLCAAVGGAGIDELAARVARLHGGVRRDSDSAARQRRVGAQHVDHLDLVRADRQRDRVDERRRQPHQRGRSARSWSVRARRSWPGDSSASAASRLRRS